MNNRVNKKMEDLLRDIDPSVLKQNQGTINKIMSSEKAKAFVSNLSDNDKQKLVESFMNMDNKKIKEKLGSLNQKGLTKNSLDEILNKLK